MTKNNNSLQIFLLNYVQNESFILFYVTDNVSLLCITSIFFIKSLQRRHQRARHIYRTTTTTKIHLQCNVMYVAAYFNLYYLQGFSAF